MAAKYKDKLNRPLTLALFKETNNTPEEYPPVYTLKDDDEGKLLSAKRIYMEAGDPTEYEAAMRITGCWQTWQKIVSSNWFKPYITEWREELEIKLRSDAYKTIAKMSTMDASSTAYNASRFIAEGKYKASEAKRGRPTKADIMREKRIQAQLDKDLTDDFERLVKPNA